jgi:protein TonB
LNLAVKHSNFNASASQGTLAWAVICSLLFHGLLVMVIPSLKFDSAKKSDLLEIQLINKPEPPSLVVPKPIEPKTEPIRQKVEPKPDSKTAIKPLSTPAAVKNEPAPYQPPPATESPRTEVIAVTPKVEATPSPMPPASVIAPTPPPVIGPSQADIDDARGKYGSTLWGAIEKHKNYPRIAQIRGWQGEVLIELLLDGNGKLKSKKVIQSSGYEALDKQALEMAEKASPFPAPPEALRGSNFSIKVPIPFRLES